MLAINLKIITKITFYYNFNFDIFFMHRLWEVGQTILGLIYPHPLTDTSTITILPLGQIVLIRLRDNNQYTLLGGMVE